MKKKKVEKLCELSMIISLLGAFGMVFGGFFFTDEAKADMAFKVSIGVFLGFGVLMMILIAIGGINFEKHGAPDIFALKYKDYDELKAYLENRMLRYHYIDQKSHTEEGVGTINIYAEEFVWSPLTCYVLIRMKEMSAENMQRIYTLLYDEMLMQYTNEHKGIKSIKMWKIICVDKITPEFQTFVENTPQLGMKAMKVNIGVDFGERKVYVANQEDGGPGILTYKNMRKDFISLMKLEKES